MKELYEEAPIMKDIYIYTLQNGYRYFVFVVVGYTIAYVKELSEGAL